MAVTSPTTGGPRPFLRAAPDHRALLVVGIPAYLAVVAFSIRDVLQLESRPLAMASIVGIAAFTALFLWLALASHPSSEELLVPILAMMALAVVLLFLGTTSAVFLAAAGAMAADSLTPRHATPFVVVGAVGVAAIGVHAHYEPIQTVTTSVIVLVVALMVMGVRRLSTTNQELVAAREELARLAIVDERLRFARDLHDLLGHSLTVIRAKSELAARVASSDMARATREMEEVEHVARTALAEVRDAVTGYRRRGLVTESHTAQTALAAAGVDAHVDIEVTEVGPDVDDALAYVLREGVTNVIRHSGATACRVSACVDDGVIRLVVADNGRGARRAPGNGLTGAHERVAQVGGTLTTRSDDAGFELVACVPRRG